MYNYENYHARDGKDRYFKKKLFSYLIIMILRYTCGEIS